MDAGRNGKSSKCRSTSIHLNSAKMGPSLGNLNRGNRTMSIRKQLFIIVPVAALALGACATSGFNSEVTRFAQLPAARGQSFAIMPLDPAMSGGIEFGQYADVVSHEMVEQGYVPAANVELADLVVQFDYDVDAGKERRRPSMGFGPDPFGPWGYPGYYGRYGGYGWGYPGYYGRRSYGGYRMGWYDPWMWGPSGYDGAESYTVYTSSLDMKIKDRGGQNIFEGRAEALSRTNKLPYLVPNLVEAMFTDFPGKSGETVRITVAPPGKS